MRWSIKTNLVASLSFFAVSLAIGLGADGWSTSPAYAGPSPASKKISIRIPGEPQTLDWNLAHTMVETYVLMNLMDGLVSLDSALKPVASLASDWSVSPDGRQYTFRLRPGVRWSDGVPLKAQDFVYSWKRLLNPLTAASYAYFLFDIEGAEDFNAGRVKDFSQVGVRVLGDQRIEVRLKAPNPFFLSMLSFWVTFPVRQDVVEAHGNSWARPGKVVTLGPYLLSAYEIANKIVLKANPNYWGVRGNIEEIDVLIISDDTTALSLYRSGRLDFLTDLPMMELKALGKQRELQRFPYLKTVYIGFNTLKEPTSNVDFRRAIAQAIQKAEIPKLLMGGQTPAQSLIPPPLEGAQMNGPGLDFSVASAKKSLKASGYSSKPIPRLELLIPAFDKTLTWAQFVQEEIKKNLGVTANIQPFDHKTFRANLDLKLYPMFAASWGADFPGADNFLSIFLSNSGNNRTGWKSSEYDALVLKARVERDSKKRLGYIRQALDLLIHKDVVILPLYFEPNLALVSDRVTGIELNPLNVLNLRRANVR